MLELEQVEEKLHELEAEVVRLQGVIQAEKQANEVQQLRIDYQTERANRAEAEAESWHELALRLSVPKLAAPDAEAGSEAREAARERGKKRGKKKKKSKK